ncbi:MAG: NADH-quinone oxidoreductase subunit NuoH [Aggregatilineales bacterium]
MSDDSQKSPISWIDLILFGIAAVLPIFFIAALWYDGYPAISYVNDLVPPADFDFNNLLWLLIPAIAGYVGFAFWGWNDVYATKFTSRAIAGFSALGLIYFVFFFLSEGLFAFTDFSSVAPLPVGNLKNLKLEGFQSFIPILAIFLVGVAQVAIPRNFERPAGEKPAHFLNFIPFSVIAINVVVGTLVLLIVLANWGSILDGGGDVLNFAFNGSSRVAEEEIILCEDSQGCSIVRPLILSAILLFVIVTGFAYATLLERKLIAWLQQRVGPNRVGPGGLLQPAADGLKLIFKEDIMPTDADRPVYLIAPMLKAIPTLVVVAVIPFGPDLVIPWFDGNWYKVGLSVIDVNVGVLWLLAITSIGTYGVVLAGWASNNKYSMLGAMRASAQMVSYELSMGLALAVPVLLVGSMNIKEIVEAQSLFWQWFIVLNPLAAGILIIALIAETNRAPFDLPEAEQELTAGYMTEYSGMKFALFMMAEYLGMIAVSLIAASMFLGGYQDGFGLVDRIPILGPVVVITKVVLLLVGFIWIRATLPRIRYDRLMQFGWKVMLPLAILAVVWTAIAVVVGDEFGSNGYLLVSFVMLAAVAIIGGVLLANGDQDDEPDADYEDDPMITGERAGIGFTALQAIGGLVAVPFVLYEGTLNILDGLASLAPEPEEETTDGDGDDTNALPANTGSD